MARPAKPLFIAFATEGISGMQHGTFADLNAFVAVADHLSLQVSA
jgi:hypothetical protein